MKFDGFPDYGEVVEPEKKEKLADHALVLMFRPIIEKPKFSWKEKIEQRSSLKHPWTPYDS